MLGMSVVYRVQALSEPRWRYHMEDTPSGESCAMEKKTTWRPYAQNESYSMPARIENQRIIRAHKREAAASKDCGKMRPGQKNYANTGL